MPKEAVFTMKLEPELRDAFMAEAAGEDRPASQVLRELMRSYIERRQQDREYNEFLHQKVKIARSQRKAGKHRSNDDVEAEAVARRAKLRRRIGEAGL